MQPGATLVTQVRSERNKASKTALTLPMDLRIRWAAGAVLLVGLLGAEAAEAQQFPSNLAPTRQSRRLDTSFQTSVDYDSDVAGGSSTAASVRRLKKGDISYSANGSVNAVLPVGALTTFLNGSVGYTSYVNNKDRSSEHINVAGGASRSVGRCLASANGSVSRNKSLLQDVTLAVSTTNQETSLSMGANASCSLFAGIGGALSYTRSQTDNNSGVGVVNVRTDSVSSSIGYRNRALGAISLGGGYQETHYLPVNALASAPASPILTSWNVGIQYERAVTRRLDGRVSVGYNSGKTKGTTLASPETSGLSADIGLNYRMSPRLSADLSFRRNINSTILAQSAFTVNTTGAVRVSYRLGRRVQLITGVTAGSRKYGGNAPSSSPVVDSDKSLTAFVNVSTKVGRLVNLSANAQYADRKTNLVDLNYGSYRLGVTASVSF